MGPEVSKCWQKPKRRSEPAKNTWGNTRKTSDGQRQTETDSTKEGNILGQFHRVESNGILCLSPWLLH